MSLDVSLLLKEGVVSCEPSSGIFIREGGTTREISREEWDERFPDREPVVVRSEVGLTNELYTANITHNLNTMATEAGIYKELWRPEEVDIDTAKQLVGPLEEGLERLKADPEKFKEFNPSNGWGSYEGLVQFVENYIEACKEYPEAEISVCR